MSQSTVCIVSLMLLVTSEGRGVPQSWRSVCICEDGTLHEQMIVARDHTYWSVMQQAIGGALCNTCMCYCYCHPLVKCRKCYTVL